MNGRGLEIVGDFSVHAELVEAFLLFFSRINNSGLTRDRYSSESIAIGSEGFVERLKDERALRANILCLPDGLVQLETQGEE
jgi:hypothetical protein